MSARERFSDVEPAVVINQSDAALNGAWRNFAISIGYGPPGAAAALDYRAAIERVRERYPDQTALITLIGERSTPTAAARVPLEGTIREVFPTLRGCAFVFESRGFGAAAQRSVLSAALIGLRLSDRVRAYASIDAALPWLTGRFTATEADAIGADLSAALLHAIADLRASCPG